MEVEGRQGIAQLFDSPPLPYGEHKVAVAPGTSTVPGGDVYAIAADAESALIDYLEMFYNLRHAGRTLTRLGMVDFATTIAPGLRDVLLTGKAAEATRRRGGGAPLYEAVVMDAPPTGRISRFLNIASEVSGLAKAGPIRAHADTVQRVIRSPETAVHFVTVLEEMPVQETLDGIAELRGLSEGGLQLGAVMINMVRPTALTDDQLTAAARGNLDRHELVLGLKTAGIEGSLGPDGSTAVADGLAAELGEHATQVLSQREYRRVLTSAGQPCYDLPLITDGMDLAGLYRLAAALQEQGAA
jgi:anion-transporting  ArsA/GET3 family ATPase